MRLFIVSGRSGAGKSIALGVLEDLGFYCVDNLPVELLPKLVRLSSKEYSSVAVSIDIRNLPSNPGDYIEFIRTLKNDKKNDSESQSNEEKEKYDEYILTGKPFTDELSLHVLFRSNDLYSAWPGNMIFLQYLGLKITDELKQTYPSLKFNGLYYNSTSLHIYKGDYEQAKRVVERCNL